jgi:hypothetical protein
MKSWVLFSMKEKQRKKRKKLISDPRFVGVHTDPRFREALKNETKVAVDSRFKRMFDDNTFFSCSAPIDKRGRPIENNLTLKSDFLCHYYKRMIKKQRMNQILLQTKKKIHTQMKILTRLICRYCYAQNSRCLVSSGIFANLSLFFNQYSFVVVIN